jgi:hypothetical protein
MLFYLKRITRCLPKFVQVTATPFAQEEEEEEVEQSQLKPNGLSSGLSDHELSRCVGAEKTTGRV